MTVRKPAHEVLPLAMLCAFVEACRRRHMVQDSVSAVPQVAAAISRAHHLL